MICPKCRFDQPDEAYCAFCGIDVKKYEQQIRKKRNKAYLLTALIAFATLSTGAYLISVYRAKNPEQVPIYSDEKDRVQTKGITASKSRRGRPAAKYKPQTQGRRDLRRPGQSREASSFRRDRGEDRPDRGAERDLDQQKAELPGKRQSGTNTPAEWFERGRALDDESEAEIEYYEKAIKLDPEFVPALYRLGAIYYRRANHELADQQFAKFLKYASEEEREAYDIYVYYSPYDVERLSGEQVAEKAPEEGVEEETSPEAEEVEEEEGLEAEKTGEETPLEAEELEEEPAAEGEETEGETTSETEGAEEETPSEGEEETGESVSEEGEETSEEVLTVVKFLPVDGHVVVPVVFNGFLEARVLVDTGAGITVLSRELAQRLQLAEEPGHGITLKTMAVDIQAQLATLDSIQVGDLIENNFRVAISDLPSGEERKFDAILGMDLLNKYKVQIDSENSRLVLSPGRSSGH
jgi:predicted aspartyl protease/tetratricopeptide (TPR) repeat protein